MQESLHGSLDLILTYFAMVVIDFLSLCEFFQTVGEARHVFDFQWQVIDVLGSGDLVFADFAGDDCYVLSSDGSVEAF